MEGERPVPDGHTRQWVALAAALFLLAMIGLGVTLHERFAQTNEKRKTQQAINRNLALANAHQIAVLHALLCFTRDSSLTNRTLTAKQKAGILDFYDGALRRIRAQPCGPVEEVNKP